MIKNVDRSEQETLLTKLTKIRETVKKIDDNKNPTTDEMKKSLRDQIFDYFDCLLERKRIYEPNTLCEFFVKT